ncbi:helicase [Methylobacterium sp. Leaf399]|uniref:DEAD/DEAH box helicase n=1 Tax=unclassified Methylobacterium TaxID=2615210 RepID=UPI0006FADAE0|nr:MULTISPECIES: DEAD/DEAH box helicase [unclassified Methylobacterium]KQP51473.1 helicase [Methylobacterium sp. Leaf108]KQT17749.1 helicase [Methylobacterium sp. Leaf399]
MMHLRPYQRASLDALHASWAAGERAGLVVLPTGAGKALVIAALVREVLAAAPDRRIAVVTHTRELIAQNHRELLGYWPQAPAGIYSAGLGRREAGAQVLFCGIQSVAGRTAEIGPVDLVIVDEAHLIPRTAETRYGRFLADLREARPDLRVVGLTATPYRLDSGRLDEGEGRLFSRIVFEANVGDLIHQGYLAPLVCKATATTLDVAHVPKRGGDYIPSALEAAVNQDWITRAAVEEMVTLGHGRRAWLAFCAGVDHARAVRDAIRAEGVSCETICGETGKRERDRIVAAFRDGRLRCLTSVGVLSTGFNVPRVDLVALLRPTQSTGLYVQQVGRALRLAPGKENGLVLDYAGLVRMHGPVDIVTARTAAAIKGRETEIRAKACPGCGALIALNASTCEACWVEPDGEAGEPSHGASAEDETPILSIAAADWLRVEGWSLASRADRDGSDSLAVTLHLAGGDRTVLRVRLEHRGHPREKAVAWWRGFGGGAAPMTVAEALDRQGDLVRPLAIRVVANGRLSQSVHYRMPGGRVYAETGRLADAMA